MNLKEEIKKRTWTAGEVNGTTLIVSPLIAEEIAESYAKEIACRFAEWYSITMEFDFHPDYGWRNINTGETYKTIEELFEKWWEENK